MDGWKSLPYIKSTIFHSIRLCGRQKAFSLPSNDKNYLEWWKNFFHFFVIIRRASIFSVSQGNSFFHDLQKHFSPLTSHECRGPLWVFIAIVSFVRPRFHSDDRHFARAPLLNCSAALNPILQMKCEFISGIFVFAFSVRWTLSWIWILIIFPAAAYAGR